MLQTLQNKKENFTRSPKVRLLFIALIATLSNCLIAEFAFAQSPNAIPYQAVARNSAGNLIASQNISLRFSIHDATAAGTVLYKETQSATTNTLGLFNVNIGLGTPITGTLAGVNWSSGAKYIQVELDASGGATYIDMGTTQLMSVPYALYAAKSGNLPNGTASGNTMHWNGTAWIVDNAIFSNGTNVGIGTATPASKLDVNGQTKTTDLQVTSGAGSGKVLQSDATGIATWVNPGTLAITETDPKVTSSGTNKIPKWNGTGLGDGIITDNGTNIGIGTTTPTTKLDVVGTTKTTALQLPSGAGAGKVLQSDATGNASWVNSTTLAITESDPQVGTLSVNKVPKWNGSTLTDGLVTDNGTNVGIGTNTPVSTLDVNGDLTAGQTNLGGGAIELNTAASGNRYAFIDFHGDDTYGDFGLRIIRENTGPNAASSILHLGTGPLSLYNYDAAPIIFGTSSAERMRVNPLGNVGIGTSTPVTKLDVNGTGQFANGTQIGGLVPQGLYGDGAKFAFRAYNAPTSDLYFQTYNGGTTNMIIRNNGNVEVAGTTKTPFLQIPTGAVNGYVLKTDASGNASWINPNILTYTETDPKVGTLATNKIPKWNGTTLANGIVTDDGTNIGVGITPTSRVHIKSSANSTTPLYIENSASAIPSFKVSQSSSGNTNVNIYNSAGTEQIRLNSSNDSWISNNLGIGNTAPTAELDVTGKTKTINFQMPTGAANNFVMKSDANGNGSWVNLSSIALSETDPQVSSTTADQVPKWNGTTLTDGIITDNGTSVGIGTTTPGAKLDVAGTIKTTNFKMVTGASNGYVLKSDANGNASWSALGTLTETDPKVGTLSSNKIPKWNGTTLADGIVTDDGTNIGIGIATPTSKLHVKSNSNFSVPFTVEKSNASTPLFTVSQGTTPGNGFVSVYDNLGIEGVHLHSTNDSWVTNDFGIGTTTPRGAFDVQKLGDIYLVNDPINGAAQSLYLPGLNYMAPHNGTDISYIQASRSDLSGTTELQIRTSNGGAFTNAVRIDGAGKVGIGTTSPSYKLDVNGTARVDDIIISTGAATGKVLTSDANGNASWASPSISNYTETDPKVGSATTNKIPKWNGAALVDGIVFDNGTKIGIGTTTPASKLDVEGGLAVGSTYSGSTAAPTDGAIIKGKVGIGTTTPASKLDVEGGLAVGSAYSGSTAAPTDGAIIQGNVGIGTNAPANKLEVVGTTKTTTLQVSNGAQVGYFLRATDVSGHTEWATPPTLTNEQDPEVTCQTADYIPKWNGSTLIDGSFRDLQYGKIALGSTSGSPTAQFTVVQNSNSQNVADFLSGNANLHTNMGIGRSTIDARIGIAASSGQYLNNATAGDFILRAENSSNKILLGTDPSQDAELAIQGQYVGVAHHLGVGMGNFGPGFGYFPNPYAVLDVFTAGSQAIIHGNGNGNQYSTSGYPLSVYGGQNGIAVQVTSGLPTGSNNFMTFFDANGNAKGAIEGQSITELNNSWEYIWFNAQSGLESAAQITSAVCAGVSGDICSLVISIAAVASAATHWGLYLNEYINNVGVLYKSGGADYAEWVPRLHPSENIMEGDIVGVTNGRITKSTYNADNLMVVSTSPMILGNVPDKNLEMNYEKVAFMGQVPVKVMGVVKTGDYILCSGNNDGFGIAKSEENMTAADYKNIVGIAWSESKFNNSISTINTLVGINATKMSKHISAMKEENDILKKQLNDVVAYLQNKDPEFKVTAKATALQAPLAPELTTVTEAHHSVEQEVNKMELNMNQYTKTISEHPEEVRKILTQVKEKLAEMNFDLNSYPQIREMLTDEKTFVATLEGNMKKLNQKLAANHTIKTGVK